MNIRETRTQAFNDVMVQFEAGTLENASQQIVTVRKEAIDIARQAAHDATVNMR